MMHYGLLAAILLDPANRNTVIIIMSNKKDDKRAHQDQATCPIKAFYGKAATDFGNVLYIARSPTKVALLEGYELMDPNAVSSFIPVAIILPTLMLL